MTNITLSEQQNEAIEIAVHGGTHVLITWCAGTGKSTVLKEIRNRLSNVSVCGTTGISALNIGWSTLHSFSGIWLGKDSAKTIVRNMYRKTMERIKKTDYLIIDEISMLSPDTFELIDEVFRTVININAPFGWITLIMFGDFLQLWPVSKWPIQYVFDSHLWKECEIHTMQLTDIFRQDDKEFCDALNKIRIGKPDAHTNEMILSRKPSEIDLMMFKDVPPTCLVSTNVEADDINDDNLSRIDSEKYSFQATAIWIASKIESFFKHSKVKESLSLKIGSSVMCITNEFSSQWVVNGSTGTVTDVGDDGIEVQFDTGFITIHKSIWEVKEDNELLTTIIQYPIILSYAISIHKSQGMTIPYLYIDLSKVFAPWQAYTALSRAKTLSSLYVIGYSPKIVKADKKALKFYNL